MIASYFQSRLHVARGGVSLDAFIYNGPDACRLERLKRTVEVTRGPDPGIGNQDCSPPSDLPCQFTQALQSAGAEYHACASLEVKGLQACL